MYEAMCGVRGGMLCGVLCNVMCGSVNGFIYGVVSGVCNVCACVCVCVCVCVCGGWRCLICLVHSVRMLRRLYSKGKIAEMFTQPVDISVGDPVVPFASLKSLGLRNILPTGV